MKRLLPALLLAAAAAASAQNLRVGLAEDPDILDPTLARTFVGRIVFAGLCDKLLDLDEKLNIVPQLATSYQWSGDNKSLVLKLRSGVTFHDGSLYVADTYNSKIKVIDPAKRSCTTFLCMGEGWLAGGLFNEPAGLSAAKGKMYVADTNAHRIRVVDLKTKVVSTLNLQGVEAPKVTP